MKALAICDADHLDASVRWWKPDAVVSVFSPRHVVGLIGGVDHLRLAFHDIEMARQRFRLGWMYGPSPSHLAGFVELMERRPARLLLQCTAGLSRSPAFAIVALVRFGMTHEDACGAVASAIPMAAPNRAVLHLAHAGLPPTAERVFDYSTRGHIGATGERIRFVEVATPPLGSFCRQEGLRGSKAQQVSRHEKSL